MKSGCFSFTADPAGRLLQIRATGLWDVATVERYDRARRQAFDGMAARGCPVERIRILVDRSDPTIQTAEVAKTLDALLSKGAPVARVAVFVGSALTKLQAERIGGSPIQSVFMTREEALAWLLETEN